MNNLWTHKPQFATGVIDYACLFAFAFPVHKAPEAAS